MPSKTQPNTPLVFLPHFVPSSFPSSFSGSPSLPLKILIQPSCSLTRSVPLFHSLHHSLAIVVVSLSLSPIRFLSLLVPFSSSLGDSSLPFGWVVHRSHSVPFYLGLIRFVPRWFVSLLVPQFDSLWWFNSLAGSLKQLLNVRRRLLYDWVMDVDNERRDVILAKALPKKKIR
ncbi:hypothetical protein RIF29_33938 [Crotalaria pallida]|uniref:Uncharacterized protein n=1 Tax=Crotalaria pallida TaxID=3830 RepID=A0AAN9HUD5_CROPI